MPQRQYLMKSLLLSNQQTYIPPNTDDKTEVKIPLAGNGFMQPKTKTRENDYPKTGRRGDP